MADKTRDLVGALLSAVKQFGDEEKPGFNLPGRKIDSKKVLYNHLSKKVSRVAVLVTDGPDELHKHRLTISLIYDCEISERKYRYITILVSYIAIMEAEEVKLSGNIEFNFYPFSLDLGEDIENLAFDFSRALCQAVKPFRGNAQ